MTKYIWLLLILISGSQMIKAQQKVPAQLIIYDSVDVCSTGSGRECTISLNIGQVLRADSLYGFNFEINYNPNKYQFQSGLMINTLAEFFENREVRLDTPGIIRGYAVNFSDNIVSGNKPLIAFTGKYTPDCEDTAEIRLTYLSFTDEFKKEIDDSGKYVTINAKVRNPGKNLNAKFLDDTLTFGTDSTANVLCKIETSDGLNLESLKAYIRIKDSTTHEIIDIIADSNTTVIDSVIKSEDKQIIWLSFKQNIKEKEILKFIIKEKIYNESLNAIYFEPLQINDCACVKNLYKDTVLLKSTKIVTVKENEEKKIIYYIRNKNIEMRLDKDYRRFEMYDILGNKLIDIDIENKSEINIDIQNMTNSVYFGLLKTKTGENKKIFLINS